MLPLSKAQARLAHSIVISKRLACASRLIIGILILEILDQIIGRRPVELYVLLTQGLAQDLGGHVR